MALRRAVAALALWGVSAEDCIAGTEECEAVSSSGLVQLSHSKLSSTDAEYVEAGTLKLPTASEKAEFLKAHNTLRCMHGAPALVWSDAVAQAASQYAGPLKTMKHDKSYQIKPPAGPAGENIFMGSGGWSATAATELWYSESNDCKGGPSGFSDGCKDGAGGAVTGHFTCMIWAGAKELGCAWSNDKKIALCRYRAGDTLSSDTPNMMPGSNYVKNVLPKSKSKAQCQSGGSGPAPAPPAPPAPAPHPPAPAPAPASGCTDSATYTDPHWGDNCAAWANYGCGGYSFSDKLMSACPKACKACKHSPAPAPPPPAACTDSTTYTDPHWGDDCAAWGSYSCSGYSFSDKLIAACPKACKTC